MREAMLQPNVIFNSTTPGSSRARRVSSGKRSLNLSSSSTARAGVRRPVAAAPALLSEMRGVNLEPNVIFSCSLGISACEIGEQWQPALTLLSDMWKVKLESNVTSCSPAVV
ncbi:unnamed protein product [Prorocentrum cordatum]|uniref:Pentatricopeptide repeat-containing protein n=1 Tax=Prorocentrum cordatum TaxID=2364126 RepID=A0ABN9VNF0_9DINO|nr:unnamed protein product [Polarella glacialis]